VSGIEIAALSMAFTSPQGETVRALDNVSINVLEGELVSVLGPSGCGKTTLLNIVAGFLAPTGGEVRVGGRSVTGPDASRGVVFQQGALFEWMSVGANVGFGPRMAGRPRSETSAKVSRLLEMVGLAQFQDTPVYQLSGGMQQRVALARCLANDPGLILLDEPLGALDALTRERMQSLIFGLWRETRKTILLITHSVEEALFLGQRVVIMAPRPGRIVKEYRLPFAERARESSPREVKSSHDFVEAGEEILSMIWSMEEEIMGSNDRNG